MSQHNVVRVSCSARTVRFMHIPSSRQLSRTRS